jgi:hypothetical protein
MVVLKQTGEFYVGSRTCENTAELDPYKGSMKTWKVNKKLLTKYILQKFDTRLLCDKAEIKLVKKVIKDPLNRNYHIPTIGFSTSGLVAHNKKSQEQFIEEVSILHPDYDFSKYIYENNSTKSTVICPLHGEYSITPSTLLSNIRCRKCYNESVGTRFRKSQEKFIEEVSILHPDYDFSKYIYENSKTNSTVICPLHGEFKITPSVLLRSQGCIICGNIKGALKRKLKSPSI